MSRRSRAPATACAWAARRCGGLRWGWLWPQPAHSVSHSTPCACWPALDWRCLQPSLSSAPPIPSCLSLPAHPAGQEDPDHQLGGAPQRGVPDERHRRARHDHARGAAPTPAGGATAALPVEQRGACPAGQLVRASLSCRPPRKSQPVCVGCLECPAAMPCSRRPSAPNPSVAPGV